MEKLHREIYQKEDGSHWIKLAHPSGIKGYKISSPELDYFAAFKDLPKRIDEKIPIQIEENSMLYVTDGNNILYPIELGFE